MILKIFQCLHAAWKRWLENLSRHMPPPYSLKPPQALLKWACRLCCWLMCWALWHIFEDTHVTIHIHKDTITAQPKEKLGLPFFRAVIMHLPQQVQGSQNVYILYRPFPCLQTNATCQPPLRSQLPGDSWARGFSQHHLVGWGCT